MSPEPSTRRSPGPDAAERQHPAQPPSPALRPGDDWQPPQDLPHVRRTPAPLLTATGVTLIALGAVWPSAIAAGLGALVAVVGVWLWAREGVASWRAWQADHPAGDA